MTQTSSTTENQDYRNTAAFSLAIDYITKLDQWRVKQPLRTVWYSDAYAKRGPPWTCTFVVSVDKKRKVFFSTGTSKKAAKNGAAYQACIFYSLV